MSYQDRQYQEDIYNACFEHLFEHTGNGVAASPGGTGKSHTMNRIIKQLVTKWPGTRVLSLVHDAKVINQNHASMLRFWPQAPAGIYSSGLKRRDTKHPIIFAGIQSVAKRINELGKWNVIFIDECDLVSPKEETLYMKLVDSVRELNPNVRILGFTATPYRMGTGCLTNSDLWDRIIIDLTKTEKFNWFVNNGFLSPLVTKKACTEIDVRNVAMKGGEFDQKSLEAVADTDELNRAVVDECIRYGHDRKHWLVFSSGVKHGQKLAKLFNSKGIPAVMLSGEDDMRFREQSEAAFRSGKYRVLVNCGLYGRGWDFPELDLLAWARATQSTALWIQGCVRLTRKAPGKKDGLVLDFAGNTRRLGPVNDPVVPQPRRKGDDVKGEAPVKECPQCFSYLHTRTMICPDCGYVFPPPSTIKKTAGTDDILKTTDSPVSVIVEHPVRGILYQEKIAKKTRMPYFKVTYMTGVSSHSEALFPEALYGKKRWENWWTFRGGELPCPKTSEQAAARAKDELHVPDLIRVDVSGKHANVVSCAFSENSL